MFKGFVVLSEDEITIGFSSIQHFGDANSAINLYIGRYNRYRYIEICFWYNTTYLFLQNEQLSFNNVEMKPWCCGCTQAAPL